MQLRFVLGPAGSGKTRRCLDAVRQALRAAPDGLPLLLLSPKQSTYYLERQLLSDPELQGYTRLHILSFERLTGFIHDQLGVKRPELLDEEGRLMVLRGILSQEKSRLELFRASARLTGFAQELSEVLREFQAQQATPESLRQFAAEYGDYGMLPAKLKDFALLLDRYNQWLTARELSDGDSLLPQAADILIGADARRFRVEHLWLDGFSEFTGQELHLLFCLLPFCNGATLSFCVDRLPGTAFSWTSAWSVPAQNLAFAEKLLSTLPGAVVENELLPRELLEAGEPQRPVLRHLEEFWHAPRPYQDAGGAPLCCHPALRAVKCDSPEGEVRFAARAILNFVRNGARFRDVAVLVRDLQGYVEPLQRILAQYDIPFFMDRRESVSHHPLAELTRSALRTVTFDWAIQDWFSALKTGLVPAGEERIDLLENEALARGWRGAAWRGPLSVKGSPELTATLVEIQERVMPPFLALRKAVMEVRLQPNGPELAAALRRFWAALKIPEQLEDWSTEPPPEQRTRLPGTVHLTVWEEMNGWLENVELAFPEERLPLREWLPVLEAGLTNLSVGLIPPALDQVLIGTIDRSRNATARLVLILGMNESRFPAPPKRGVLLTESDRVALEGKGALRWTSARHHLGRERFLAYTAFTRARERLCLTFAAEDAGGTPLNVSSYLTQLQRLFPALQFEQSPQQVPWQQAEHASELIQPLVQAISSRAEAGGLLAWPETSRVARLISELKTGFGLTKRGDVLCPSVVDKLYGKVLNTSVSRLEQFAACPFKFFINSGLRAEDRRLFELDAKEQGSYLHDLLAAFHNQLAAEGLRWRDVTPDVATTRLERLALNAISTYRDGLLQATERSRFQARLLTATLNDFLRTVIEWMRSQYAFDPVRVELPFGEEGSPAWELSLTGGQRVRLRGRIDRVDVYRDPESGQAWCVVIDYKSGQKQLDPVMVGNGLQLQLLTYLSVLRHAGDWCATHLGAPMLPAGVFYLNLRGRYSGETNRDEALANAAEGRKLAYQHLGRFDAALLRAFDSRPNATAGDQFRYRLNRDGSLSKQSKDPLPSGELARLLSKTEDVLRTMAEAIYSGDVGVAPYRLRSATACEQCDYASVCRMDPWVQSYRVLRMPAESGPTSEAAAAQP